MNDTADPRQPLHERVVEVFAAPRRLFARFEAWTPWLGALLLSTLLAAAVSGLQPDDFYLAQTENPVNRRGEPITITTGPAGRVFWGRLLTMLGTLVSHPTFAFAIAGLLTLLFTVLGRGRAGFLQYLTVTSHALLIGGVGALATALIRWSVGGADFLLSPALLFEPGAVGLLPRLASALDLFTLWMIGVLAVGVSTLDGQRSWPAAAALLAGVYLAVTAATATLFG